MNVNKKLIVSLLACSLISPVFAGQQSVNKRSRNVVKTVRQQVPVNVNAVDEKTLANNVKGIGKGRARHIIAYRNAHGKFKSVDDLAKVKGISKKLVAKIRRQLTV